MPEDEKLDESLAQTKLGLDRSSDDDQDSAISLAQTRAATFEAHSTDERVKETGPESIAATLIPTGDSPPAPSSAPAFSVSALMRTAVAQAEESADPGFIDRDSGDKRDVSLVQTRISEGDDLEPPADAAEERPLSFARTITPADAARSRSASRASLRRDEAITDDPDLARRVLKPEGEDGRLKDLIRARLFRKKAAPVKIGRYTILDRLGEGGMGVVYTAFDDKLERKIAIKVMRSDSEEGSNGRVRLIREAQAMARLAHPHIVTVHEVGEVDDQIFVAMEYIRGQSLDQWQQEPHPWREVVDVFLQAGRGLAAAHDAGIVHRDFKPHNVLLGEDGTAKVLDFGLARAITQGQLSEAADDNVDNVDNPNQDESAEENPQTALVPTDGKALSLLDQRLTRTGAIMGTPAYMAPEQHEGRTATALSDQFSFCVALYEGLYGELPFEAGTLPILLASVLEGKVKEPPPAAKVPGWLRKVVLRGLAVEPERRFPSVSALLVELGRDPVARRRRWLATAAFAGLVGAAGFGAASVGSAQAAVCTGAADEIAEVWGPQQRGEIERAFTATGVTYGADTWDMISPQLDAYASEWATMRAEACESHQRGANSETIFDRRTACLDLRRASLSGLVDAFTSPDSEVIDNAPKAIASLPSIASCADTKHLLSALPPPTDPAKAAAVGQVRLSLAKAKSSELAGKYDSAASSLAALRARATPLEHPPLMIEIDVQQGSLSMHLNEAQLADERLSHALWEAISIGHDNAALEAVTKRIFVRSFLRGEASVALGDVDLALSLANRASATPLEMALLYNNIAVAHHEQGDLDEARTAYREAESRLSESTSPNDYYLGSFLSNRGTLEIKARQYERAHAIFQQAQERFEQSIGSSHPHSIAVQSNLAIALLGMGSLAKAHETMTAAAELAHQSIGEDSVGKLWLDYQATDTAIALRHYDDAILTLTRVREHAADKLGAQSLLTILTTGGLATCLSATDQHEDALSLHEEIEKILAEGDAIDPMLRSKALDEYGSALRDSGDFEGALQKHLEALRVEETILPKISPVIAITLEKLAQTYIALERYDDAKASLARAKTIVDDQLPPTSQLTATVLRTAAELAIASGDASSAVEPARAALTIHESTRDADDGELALTRFALSRAIEGATPGSDEAEALAKQALEVLRTRGDGWSSEAAQVDAWLQAR